MLLQAYAGCRREALAWMWLRTRSYARHALRIAVNIIPDQEGAEQVLEQASKEWISACQTENRLREYGFFDNEWLLVAILEQLLERDPAGRIEWLDNSPGISSTDEPPLFDDDDRDEMRELLRLRIECRLICCELDNLYGAGVELFFNNYIRYKDTIVISDWIRRGDIRLANWVNHSHDLKEYARDYTSRFFDYLPDWIDPEASAGRFLNIVSLPWLRDPASSDLPDDEWWL